MLGIDPGLCITGFGIAKREGNSTKLIDYGYLRLPQTRSLPARVRMFHDFVELKIAECSITDIAIETPFLGKNAQNFLKLGYLRGIIYCLSDKHNLVLHEFPPSQVKLAVTGYGGASKEQVARVILRLFPGLKAPDKQDVTDALAVTLCGIWKAPISHALGKLSQ